MIRGKVLTLPSYMLTLLNFEFHLLQYHAALRCTKNQMDLALVDSLLEPAWYGLKLLTGVKHLELTFLKFTMQQKMLIFTILR